MQELLGRISALDPSASLGIRVIACFDELIVGQVNVHGLLAAAAALAGCPAGLDHAGEITRVSSMGETLERNAPPAVSSERVSDELTVWIEREGQAQPNDAIILERLALAVRIRFTDHGPGSATRDMHAVLDDQIEQQRRREAAARLGLSAGTRYRVVAAPLFAQWTHSLPWPSDVMTTPHGTLHVLIAPASTTDAPATPSGIGGIAQIDDLPYSLRTATIALRLTRAPAQGSICADEFGGLIDILADVRSESSNPDVAALDSLMREAPWTSETVDAVLASATVRQASRTLGIHHSTMQSRLETMRSALGFEPIDGYGRTRLGLAYLLCRLRRSRVLDLPAPGAAAPRIG